MEKQVIEEEAGKDVPTAQGEKDSGSVSAPTSGGSGFSL
jgi:hypothetical protein